MRETQVEVNHTSRDHGRFLHGKLDLNVAGAARDIQHHGTHDLLVKWAGECQCYEQPKHRAAVVA